MKKKLTVYVIPQPTESWDVETCGMKKKVTYFPYCFDTYCKQKAITSVEIEVEVPDELTYEDLKLQALREQLANVNAEFGRRVTEINAQINELLAIEG
jgi:hypothetical protein